MNAAVNMETSWGKCLEMLPQFTIKEIERHRQLSGRTPESAIIKTLDRDKGIFHVRGLCKASMKKERRPVAVKLSTITSKVLGGSCSCPAGKSGYCNHVIAMLLELADYSLSQFNSFMTDIVII